MKLGLKIARENGKKTQAAKKWFLYNPNVIMDTLTEVFHSSGFGHLVKTI